MFAKIGRIRVCYKRKSAIDGTACRYHLYQMMQTPDLSMLDQRSRRVFEQLVQNYLETGQPVPSALLAQAETIGYSPATVRAIMSELENAGLLFSPHVSAGRVPTHAGLRLFVDGLMQIGSELPAEEQASIDHLAGLQGLSVNQLLDKASQALSGLSRCASLVMAPTEDLAIRHIEFVPVADRRLLVILVFEGGQVENRLISLPAGLPASALSEAANFMNYHYTGMTIGTIGARLDADLTANRAALDDLSADLIARGLAVWSDGSGSADAALIFNGQTHLLEGLGGEENMGELRGLFDIIEMRKHAQTLLEKVAAADGLQIYIGSEHSLFDRTGFSMVLSPYRDGQQRVVGAIGVIGPRHMNYARIIPMVDYTSATIARLLS